MPQILNKFFKLFFNIKNLMSSIMIFKKSENLAIFYGMGKNIFAWISNISIFFMINFRRKKIAFHIGMSNLCPCPILSDI